MTEPTVGSARHLGGFVLGGALAFITDVTILLVLTRLVGLSPFIARLASIAMAMVVSWWINRTVSFPTGKPASVAEFLRFAGVASVANTFSYVVFSGILLLRPATSDIVAIVISVLFAMVLSYLGMRHAVFRR